MQCEHRFFRRYHFFLDSPLRSFWIHQITNLIQTLNFPISSSFFSIWNHFLLSQLSCWHIIIGGQPIMNAMPHFVRNEVALPAQPQFWQTGKSGTPYEKQQLFQGEKLKKICPNFFCGLPIHIENTFCKKIGSKRSFQPSAVVRAIYRGLYGVATAN